MLNDLEEIKRLWPGDVLNMDDEEIVKDDKTAYDLYLEREGLKIKRRLVNWVGAAAYEDAALTTPSDPDRSDALKDAELELFHANIMEKLWRDKSAGAERDVQLPSGMRISLQVFSSDEYRAIIEAHVSNAGDMITEYIE